MIWDFILGPPLTPRVSLDKRVYFFGPVLSLKNRAGVLGGSADMGPLEELVVCAGTIQASDAFVSVFLPFPLPPPSVNISGRRLILVLSPPAPCLALGLTHDRCPRWFLSRIR